jgi:hypothetical protein
MTGEVCNPSIRNVALFFLLIPCSLVHPTHLSRRPSQSKRPGKAIAISQRHSQQQGDARLQKLLGYQRCFSLPILQAMRPAQVTPTQVRRAYLTVMVPYPLTLSRPDDYCASRINDENFEDLSWL